MFSPSRRKYGRYYLLAAATLAGQAAGCRCLRTRHPIKAKRAFPGKFPAGPLCLPEPGICPNHLKNRNGPLHFA